MITSTCYIHLFALSIVYELRVLIQVKYIFCLISLQRPDFSFQFIILNNVDDIKRSLNGQFF